MRKPEVGDIYISDCGNAKFLITQKLSKTDFMHASLYKDGELESGYTSDWEIEEQNWKYLGKAKANISDLFEVEE